MACGHNNVWGTELNPLTLIMSHMLYKCAHCGRNNFTSQQGLNQHQNQNKGCKAKMWAALGNVSTFTEAHSFVNITQVRATGGRLINDNFTVREFQNMNNTAQKDLTTDLLPSMEKSTT